MNLAQVLAQYALGELRPERAPDVATELIARGLESPAACELASMREPTWRDARELFLEAIEAAGLRVPDRDDAYWKGVVATLEGLADGSMSAREGAGRLWLVWGDQECPDNLTPFVGQASEWDDHPEARVEIEKEIRALARDVLPAYRARAV